MKFEKGFDLHPGAALDITEIWESIADDRPLAAGRFREEIWKTIDALVSFPNQGHRRPDLTTRPLRFVPVRDYLIAYAPDEKPLLVIAGLHGRPDPRSIAPMLEQRQ